MPHWPKTRMESILKSPVSKHISLGQANAPPISHRANGTCNWIPTWENKKGKTKTV